MHTEKWLLSALFLAATMSAGNAAGENAIRGQIAPPSQSLLFASPLLSESEQADYRASIRAAKDGAERERIRAAHYELMKARAKERGYALPETRPAAVGEAGNAFGPRLIPEEERAAQRALLRGAVKQPSAEVAGPPQGKPAAGTPPGTREQAVASRQRPIEAISEVGARPTTPGVSAARPPESLLGGVVLSGIDALFGPQLMSEEERAVFRARLRRAKSDGERQAIHAERDEQMRLRAKEKGIALP